MGEWDYTSEVMIPMLPYHEYTGTRYAYKALDIVCSDFGDPNVTVP